MTSTSTYTDHGTLPDRTYERIRDLIIRGRMPPGSRVVEVDVSARFGISRTPVREALSRLLHERYLVATSPGKRTELIVAPLSEEDVAELWGMIGALEAYAIAIVAGLSEPRRAHIADSLRQLNSELRAASTSRPRDPDRLFELQTNFHLRFVHEATGPAFRSVYDALRPQVQRYEWIYGTRSDAEYEPSASEHLDIIAAVGKGDKELARSSVLSHWEKAAARTVKVLDGLAINPPELNVPRRAPRAPR